MLKIEQLYYLTQVAKYNSINKAAEHLYITSAAVSAAIKQMERECGYEILERTYRGVRLTEKGRKVVKLAEQMMALHDEVIALGHETEMVKEKYNLTVTRSTLKLLQNKIVGPQASVLEYFNVVEIGNEIKNYYSYLEDSIVLTTFQNPERELFENDESLQIRYIYASKLYPVSSKTTKFIKENIKYISPKEFEKLPKIKLGSGVDLVESNVMLATDDPGIYGEAIYNDYGVGLITRFAPDILAFDSSKLKVYEPFKHGEIYIAVITSKNGNLNAVDLLEKLIKR